MAWNGTTIPRAAGVSAISLLADALQAACWRTRAIQLLRAHVSLTSLGICNVADAFCWPCHSWVGSDHFAGMVIVLFYLAARQPWAVAATGAVLASGSGWLKATSHLFPYYRTVSLELAALAARLPRPPYAAHLRTPCSILNIRASLERERTAAAFLPLPATCTPDL